jgi:hypothetical protein
MGLEVTGFAGFEGECSSLFQTISAVSIDKIQPRGSREPPSRWLIAVFDAFKERAKRDRY